MASKKIKDWMNHLEKNFGIHIVNKDELNVLDDGTVETYQELKSDRDRLHNIYIQQSLEIRDLRARLKEVNYLLTK